MTPDASLDGLVPENLAPKTRKIVFEDYELEVDIGFHPSEIGRPQRLMVTVEIWLDEASFAGDDRIESAWNYDYLHREIAQLAGGGRFNLQETLARRIYDLVAARKGVVGVRVATRKPDIYPDCRGVGVEIASF